MRQNPHLPSKIRSGDTLQLVLNGFIFRVAERIQTALPADWFSRPAQRAPMVNNLVREQDPLTLRKRLHQIFLNLDRFGVPGKIEPPGYPLHMRVDDYSRSNPECGSQYNIGGLASGPGNREQFVNRLRNLAAVFA